ncbi:MAG: hypothetical protein CMH49_05345 [Myxococcales bacterium]|nr:hypothetical protein [Myxococcales bacterium]
MIKTDILKPKKLRVLCVSIEASGDRLLALGIQAFKKSYPGSLELVGIGGQHSQAEGLVSFIDPKKLAAHGLSEALHVLPQSINAYYKLKQLAHDVDFCMLVDSPELSMRLLSWIKTHRIESIRKTTVFYIAPPQVWAWRSHRAKTLALADELLCLFNFEAQWFKNRHISARLIGHPMAIKQDEAKLQKGVGSIFKKGLVIAFFPGSRQSSVSRSFLLGLLSLAEFAVATKQMITINIAYTSWVNKDVYLKYIKAVQIQLLSWGWHKSEPADEEYNQGFEQWSTHEVGIRWNDIDSNSILSDQSIVPSQRHIALKQASFSVCHAGTSTLESALAGVVPVSIAPLSKLSTFMAKRLINIEHCALPNLCLNRRAFPEVHAETCHVESVVKALIKVYKHLDHYQDQLIELRQIVKPWSEQDMMASIKSQLSLRGLNNS